jgi:hypothetical protein
MFTTILNVVLFRYNINLIKNSMFTPILNVVVQVHRRMSAAPLPRPEREHVDVVQGDDLHCAGHDLLLPPQHSKVPRNAGDKQNKEN